MKVVLVTGGFDPLHSGHIAYFKAARELGDYLVVGLNSDDWLTRKKGRHFTPFEERASIVQELACVDEVIEFDDSNDTAVQAIETVLAWNNYEKIIFANGGDRKRGNVPEEKYYRNEDSVEFVFGVGGEDKKNSSSWILTEWKSPKTPRPWGYYRVLHEVPGMKVKELTVDPGASLSMQRHFKRAEYWIVSQGRAVVYTALDSGYAAPPQTLELHDEMHIPVTGWHQLTNPFDEPVKIVEIQYGKDCVEEDIERRN